MMNRMDTMKLREERGVALIVTLFLMLAVSAISASLMFLSQTEVSSSVNYRLMSQARYGAESGIQSAMNYLLYTYVKPTTGGADPIAAYDTTVSPVTFNGQPVVLSANAAVASNYPVAAVQNAFSAAVQGTLAAGTMTTVAYAPYATLLSMKQIIAYGGVPQTIQTWQVTSTGTIGAGLRNAQVEVSAVLETQSMPADVYGAFGTSGSCGALTLAGGASVDSYNSADPLVGGAPVISQSGGNVGTNGNLTAGGATTVVHGSLSTPRVGVGNCSNGNVDAFTSSGGATVDSGVVQLPQAVSLPTPIAPNPLPPTGNVNINATTTYAPGSYADLRVNGGDLHLTAGTYNLNSLTVAGGARVVIDSGPVIINLAGVNQNNVLNFSGTAELVNTTFDASMVQIQYAGTENISLTGGSQFAAMVYAPNADVSLAGGSDFYGAIVGSTVTDTGGANIHFDRNLTGKFFAAGNPMMSAFTWKKY
jgi:hypothetical protein